MSGATETKQLQHHGTRPALFTCILIHGFISHNAKELPDLGNASELDVTSDLQSLANNVASDDPNDKFSAILNQALGLLEQDYEDEYSESQILERREIQEAFAEHSTKKG